MNYYITKCLAAWFKHRICKWLKFAVGVLTMPFSLTSTIQPPLKFGSTSLQLPGLGTGELKF